MRPPTLVPLLSAWLLSPASASAPAAADPASFGQASLAVEPAPSTAARALKGRFLHLTDLHPDPLYAFNATEALACHFHSKKDLAAWGAHGQEDGLQGWSSKKSKDEDDRAGYWGTPISDCDTPLSLINATLDWVAANLHDEVDFVVWTGDSARHDIDLAYPRSMPEIFALNRQLSTRIRDIFGKHVPIIPSFGNNDIYPHNIMFGGPSAVTSEFLEIWKHFIPESQLHTFARGGYFTVDALPSEPNTLSVVSLNTLYFFENNKAVDGCPAAPELWSATATERLDPGTEHLLWLEQQLLLARHAGTKVWLTGHVPATKAMWYEGCFKGYVELGLRFHDTIVGHLFGHMNVDHFAFLRASDLDGRFPPIDDGPSAAGLSGGVRANAKSSGQQAVSVKADLSDLPRRGKTFLGDFGVVNVNPSVIPTFLPALRVYSFNVTRPGTTPAPGLPLVEEECSADEGDDYELDSAEAEGEAGVASGVLGRAAGWVAEAYEALKKKKGKGRKKRPTLEPRHYSPTAPSVINTFLSPLGFTQFFLDLDAANAHDGYGPGTDGATRLARGGQRPSPQFEVEYTSWGKKALVRGLRGEWGQPGPVPARLLPRKVRVALEGGEAGRAEQVVKKLGLAPYGMKDLTVGSWIRLARKVTGTKKAWKKFERRMFVSSGATD